MLGRNEASLENHAQVAPFLRGIEGKSKKKDGFDVKAILLLRPAILSRNTICEAPSTRSGTLAQRRES